MANILHFDLAHLLPDITDAHDDCLVRLISTLGAHQGIAGVHVVEGPTHIPLQLCIHYDAGELPASQVASLVTALSEPLRTRFGHVTARLISPQHLCKAVERLGGRAGVRSVATHADGSLRIEYNRDRTSEAKIRAVLSEVTHDDDPPGGSSRKAS